MAGGLGVIPYGELARRGCGLGSGCTGYVGAGRAELIAPSHETTRKRVLGVWLAAACELVSCQPQVPSPAQAAQVGWHTPRFVRTSPVNQLALRASGLLRLGVKRFQRARCG
ncbi:MAG: hypothetical protein R3C56_01785 [Pirellulaceae bacterium]